MSHSEKLVMFIFASFCAAISASILILLLSFNPEMDPFPEWKGDWNQVIAVTYAEVVRLFIMTSFLVWLCLLGILFTSLKLSALHREVSLSKKIIELRDRQLILTDAFDQKEIVFANLKNAALKFQKNIDSAAKLQVQDEESSQSYIVSAEHARACLDVALSKSHFWEMHTAARELNYPVFSKLAEHLKWREGEDPR